MTTRADTTKVREALQETIAVYNRAHNEYEFGKAFTNGPLDKCLAALAALDSTAQEGAGPVADAECPKCGAPCVTEVHMRGGDWGWGATDAERTQYRYLAPQPSPSEWERAYHYVTSRLPLDPQNRARDTTCPMQLAEIDRDLVDRFCQPSPSGPVAIKPLVWTEDEEGDWHAQAANEITLSVHKYYPTGFRLYRNNRLIGYATTFDNGKQQAESVWQAYVRSLLAPVPVTEAERKLAALEWAVDQCEEIGTCHGEPYSRSYAVKDNIRCMYERRLEQTAATPVPSAHDAEGKVDDAMVERACAGASKAAETSFDQRHVIRAALEAALSTNSDAGWLPIESAPKDGTHVLLRVRDRLSVNSTELYQGLQFVGHNNGDSMLWKFAGNVGVGGIPDSWLSGWQPLPAPPSTNKGQT